MAETTSENIVSENIVTVRQLRQSIWEVKVSAQQLRMLIERLIWESTPEANFALGNRPIYIWVQEEDIDPDDLSEADELSEGCVGPAFSALVFEEPVG